MVVAHAVDELDARKFALVFEADEELFDGVDVHAVLVHGDGEDLGAEGGEGAGVDEVGGGFGDDDVAGVEEGVADEVEGLLRAGGDENVGRGEAHGLGGVAFEVFEVGEEEFAEGF